MYLRIPIFFQESIALSPSFDDVKTVTRPFSDPTQELPTSTLPTSLHIQKFSPSLENSKTSTISPSRISSSGSNPVDLASSHLQSTSASLSDTSSNPGALSSSLASQSPKRPVLRLDDFFTRGYQNN